MKGSTDQLLDVLLHGERAGHLADVLDLPVPQFGVLAADAIPAQLGLHSKLWEYKGRIISRGSGRSRPFSRWLGERMRPIFQWWVGLCWRGR